MAHSNEMRWGEAYRDVADYAEAIKKNLIEAEEVYQELLEVFQFAGGTTQAMADLLFQAINGNPDPITDTATADQVAMVADLSAATTALHELYLAMTNGVITQEDRAASLRRLT